MKKLLLLTLSCIISYVITAQNQPDSIYAVVDGNYVTIYDSGSFRNCGALYDMIITKDGYQLTWLQDDYGMAAYCYCNFDLSVTAGPLDAGHYFVDVYYTEI